MSIFPAAAVVQRLRRWISLRGPGFDSSWHPYQSLVPTGRASASQTCFRAPAPCRKSFTFTWAHPSLQNEGVHDGKGFKWQRIHILYFEKY